MAAASGACVWAWACGRVCVGVCVWACVCIVVAIVVIVIVVAIVVIVIVVAIVVLGCMYLLNFVYVLSHLIMTSKNKRDDS